MWGKFCIWTDYCKNCFHCTFFNWISAQNAKSTHLTRDRLWEIKQESKLGFLKARIVKNRRTKANLLKKQEQEKTTIKKNQRKNKKILKNYFLRAKQFLEIMIVEDWFENNKCAIFRRTENGLCHRKRVASDLFCSLYNRNHLWVKIIPTNAFAPIYWTYL